VKADMMKVLERLHDSYNVNMKARAGQLQKGRSYKSNPRAQKALDEKAASYSQGTTLGSEAAPAQKGGPTAASKGLKKPAQVEQADWDRATDEERLALAAHFSKKSQ
jgi:hypothetical protein